MKEKKAEQPVEKKEQPESHEGHRWTILKVFGLIIVVAVVVIVLYRFFIH